MTRVAALLRAVNVGGRKVGMAELRGAVADLDLRDVRTLLQSGNLVFEVADDRAGTVAAEIETSISAHFGIDIPILVRTHEELRALSSACPYAVDDAKTVHVVFLDREPTAEAVAALDPDRSPPDRFTVVGREVFVHYPRGSGRSKLTLSWFEKGLGAVGTARNWNTVVKLTELTAAGS